MISIDTQWVNRVKNTKTNGFFVFDFTLITIHLSFFFGMLVIIVIFHSFIQYSIVNIKFSVSVIFISFPVFFLFVVVLIIVVTKLYYGKTVIITMVFFVGNTKFPKKNPAREYER